MNFRLKRQIKNVYILCFLLWCLASVAVAGEMESARYEANAEESRRCLIAGVYYLVNAGDRDTAEGLFRKAIFYGSFSDLSRESDVVATSELSNGWIAAEAFYFLGKINYERAISQGDVEKNIAQAKKYLKKAEEYGVVYDKLHPPLLDEIDRKYPGIDMAVSETEVGRARVIIEIDRGASYKIDAVKVNQHADVTESRFLTNQELDLECGARYKVKPDVEGGRGAVYRALTFLGLGLLVWLTRG